MRALSSWYVQPRGRVKVLGLRQWGGERRWRHQLLYLSYLHHHVSCPSLPFDHHLRLTIIRLALPSRPDRAITFDLAALVQRNKPYGPVLGARGIKYYINVGTREVARGPCPPGFGCAVYANGSVASLGYEMSYDDNIIDSLSPYSEATGAAYTFIASSPPCMTLSTDPGTGRYPQRCPARRRSRRACG